MHIHDRIMSRKIMVMVVYEHLMQSLQYTESFVYIPIESPSQTRYHISLFDDPIASLAHMGYMAEWFFDTSKNPVLDADFLRPMIEQRNNAIDTIISSIDRHSTTFWFMKMDPMDQAIFLTGVIEYTVHHTPRQIILNEMIEICKRYGDEWSAKLINGIGHKVIDDIEKNQHKL